MSVAGQVRETLAWLEARGSKQAVKDMRTRYGITTTKAYGNSMGDIQRLGKQLGRNHALALALWKTGRYEARLLTAYVDELDAVTSAQMDRWAGDFDNWGICDTLCFALWDRSPHAWKKVAQWSRRREEFVKRAAFALLASMALHDKTAPDSRFLKALTLIERAAVDDRNFVWKGVSWALRAMGKRSPAVRNEALALARRLAASEAPSARRIGKEALR